MSIFSTDLEKIPYIFSYFGLACGAVIALFTTSILVGVLHGYLAGLTCLSAILIISSIQAALGVKQGSLRSKIANRSDKRIHFMNEILTGILTIKMQVWERYFKEKINKLRRNEIAELLMSFIYTISIRILGTVAVKVVFFLVVLVTKLTEPDTLNPYSTLRLISLVLLLEMDVFYFLPELIFLTKECIISLKRIEVKKNKFS